MPGLLSEPGDQDKNKAVADRCDGLLEGAWGREAGCSAAGKDGFGARDSNREASAAWRAAAGEAVCGKNSEGEVEG